MQHFVSGLKSRSEETRARIAGELNHYVTTELREISNDDLTAFMDEMNHQIFEMVSSPDVNERKGGVLAIGRFAAPNSPNLGSVSAFRSCFLSRECWKYWISLSWAIFNAIQYVGRF
jgi:FKBP12-rapamycin complex-associated protein